jgi:hypothetical protein
MNKSSCHSRLLACLWAVLGSLVALDGRASSAAPAAPAGFGDNVMLVAFFRGNGETGVFLAASEDGRRFTPLNGDRPVIKPAPWEKQDLTRDPSIVYRNGKFHVTWTTHWKGDCFAYAESSDLVTWSEPVRVEPFGDKKPVNTWAPEICWDPAQQNFLIVWSSCLGQPSNRIFATRTADGKKFTAAEPFLKRDFGCIDAYLLREESARRWVMIYKNEEAEAKGGKNLRVATAPLDFSAPWVDLVDRPIIGPGSAVAADTMTEGPTLLKLNNEYLLYWDSPLKGKMPAHMQKADSSALADDSFGLASSTDLITWKDHTSELSLPRNVRHGTVFLAPRAAVGWLKAK